MKCNHRENMSHCTECCGEEHKEVFAELRRLQSELAEARAEVEDLSRKNSSFVDEIVTLKAEVERVRKTWAANWQEQKGQVEELRALMADMVRAFEILEPDEIVNSAVLNRMKAALTKGEAE